MFSYLPLLVLIVMTASTGFDAIPRRKRCCCHCRRVVHWQYCWTAWIYRATGNLRNTLAFVCRMTPVSLLNVARATNFIRWRLSDRLLHLLFDLRLLTRICQDKPLRR